MKKIKILHILTTTAGGLGQSVLSLVTRLDPEKFDVVVAFGPGYPLDQAFAEKGIRVVAVRMKRGLHWNNLLGFWDLYRLLRRERFDIVHAHAPIAGFLGRVAARLARVGIVIFTLHGGSTLNDQSLLNRSLLRFVEKLLDRCTDHYVAVSDYVQQRWRRRWIASQKPVTLIYHGGAERGAAIDSPGRRKALGFDPGKPLVGTVGLLEKQKGTENFIRAVPRVLQSFPECQFAVIGDGPLRRPLEETAERLGVSRSVRFLGWRNDAAELIGMFDLFCLPSLWESFGLVLLEAMAHAKPVVATEVGGVPEVVANGETGLLVPPEDPVSLSKAIAYFLTHPEIAAEMGKRGEARLAERFTLTRMVEQYERFYMSVIRERAGAGEAVFAEGGTR